MQQATVSATAILLFQTLRNPKRWLILEKAAEVIPNHPEMPVPRQYGQYGSSKMLWPQPLGTYGFRISRVWHMTSRTFEPCIDGLMDHDSPCKRRRRYYSYYSKWGPSLELAMASKAPELVLPSSVRVYSFIFFSHSLLRSAAPSAMWQAARRADKLPSTQCSLLASAEGEDGCRGKSPQEVLCLGFGLGAALRCLALSSGPFV